MAHSEAMKRGLNLGKVRWAGWIGVVLGVGLHAATRTVDVLDLLNSVPINASTAALARKEGFALDKIRVGIAARPLDADDTVTGVVSLFSFDGHQPVTQWLIRLRLAAATPQEQAMFKGRDVTYFANTGDSFTFHSGVTAMELEAVGPIEPETKENFSVKLKRHRIFALTDYLGLDLMRTAEVLRRFGEETGKSNPSRAAIQLSSQDHPFGADEVKIGRRDLAFLNAENIRSFCGSLPALEQFLFIVRSTPDLENILWQVLDKPSLFDVLRHGSSNAVHFDFMGGGPSEAGRRYFFGQEGKTPCGLLMFNLEVFGKPVLTVVLFVTTPQPPLQLSAGIVGVVAWSPSKLDKVVAVRVLSSAFGETSRPEATAGKAGSK